MNNVKQYINNLGRSVKYSAVDAIKKQAPAMTEMATMNSDLFKEINYSFRNRRQIIQRTGKLIENSKLYEAVNETRKSVFEDLKTGNFYNKSRAEKINKRALGFNDEDGLSDIMSGDDIDISLGDDNIDYDKLLSEGDIATIDAIESTSRSSASMISNAVAKSSDYIVESNKAIAKMGYIQNIELFTGLNKSISSLNENIISGISSVGDTLTTHAKNSKTFYEEHTKYARENNALLKELVEMERNRYQKEQIKERTGTRYDDIVGSEGGIDLKAYFKQVGKNASNKLSSISSIGNLFGEDSNALLTLAASPLQFITDFVADKMIGNSIKSTISNLDKSISGAFGTLLSKFNLMGRSDNGITRIIGELLGIDNRMKRDIDTSKYNKGAVQWNGKSEKALTYVLPTLVSKILSVISGQAEQTYDYESGKFKTKASLKSEFKGLKKSAVDSSTSDVRAEFENMLKTIRPDKIEDQKMLKKDMDEFFNFFFDNGIMFDHRGKDFDFYRNQGLNIDDVNYQIFRGLFRSMSRDKQLRFNSDILEGRAKYNDQLARLEQEGTIFASLFDNSDKMKTVDVNSKGDVTKSYGIGGLFTNSKDELGKNVFWYLRSIYETLATGIKVYSLNGSGGKNRFKVNDSTIKDILGRSATVTNSSYNNDGYYNEQDSYEKKKDRYMRKNKNAVSLESLISGNDRDISAAVEAHISYVNEQNEIKNKANSKRKPTFIDELLKTGNLSEKISKVTDKIKNFASKPQELIANAINLADIRLYEVLYGTESKTYKGEKVNGVIDMLVVDMKHTFNHFNDWLDEKILTPIKEKLDQHGGIKGMFRSALEKFGIDPDDNIFTRGKDYFFGEGSIFAEVKNNIKEDFKDMTNYVKTSFKSVYEEIDNTLHIKSKARSLSERFNNKADNENSDDESTSPQSSIRTAVNAAGKKVTMSSRGKVKSLSQDEKQAAMDIVKNIPHYDTGAKYINKTQVALIHKGEAVLRPEERLEYERLKKMRSNFRDARGIESGFGREYMYGRKISKTRLDKDNDYTDKESLLYRMNVEVNDILSNVKKSLFGTDDTKEFDEKFNKVKEDISKNFKEYFPKTASGGVLGFGTAFLFGMNPLLGATVGAATSLIRRSSNLQDYLFGEKDEEGKYQGGALLNSKAMDVIQRYVPDMAKYGITGAITSLIPFVPGGPIAGLMLGSGVGFLKHNREFSEALFGKDFNMDDAMKTIKDKLPKLGIGAIGGALLGPFGLIGNLMLGSAVGWMSDTDKFKQLMYGKENPESGEMEGGILPSIRETIVKPMSEWAKGAKSSVLTFISEEIRKPMKMAIKPFIREFKHIGSSIVERVGKGLDSIFEKAVGAPTKEFLQEKVFKPFSNFFTGMAKFGINFTKGMITAPVKLLSGAGDKLALKQLKRDGIEGFDQEELLYRYQQDPKKFIKNLRKSGQFSRLSKSEIDGIMSNIDKESEKQKEASVTTQKGKDSDNKYNQPNSVEVDSNNQLKAIHQELQKMNNTHTMATEFGVMRYDTDVSGEARPIQDNVYKKVVEDKAIKEAKQQALFDMLLSKRKVDKDKETKESKFNLMDLLKLIGGGLALGGLISPFLPNDSKLDVDGSYIQDWDNQETSIRAARKIIPGTMKGARKIGKTVINKGANLIDNISTKVKDNKTLKFIVDKTKNSKVGKFVAETTSKGIDATKGIASSVSDTVQNAANKVKNSNIVKTSQKYVDEFITKANDVLLKILGSIDEFTTKHGFSISQHIDKIMNRLSALLDPKILSKFTTEISEKMIKATASVYTFAVSDIPWAVWGALTGGTKTETAHLFMIPQDYVTFPMQIISGSLKCLMNVSWLFVIDILNEVSKIVFGNDFIHELAINVYDVFASDQSMDKLKIGKAELQQEYQQYKTDNNLEDLSFDAYNDKVNSSATSKAIDSVKQFGSNVKEKASNMWNSTKQFGSNVLENTKEFANKAWESSKGAVSQMMRLNPLTALPNAIKYANGEGADLHLLDRLQGSLAKAIESMTFGTVSFESSMKGLGNTRELLSKIGSSIGSGIKHIMQNNPLNVVGNGYRLLTGEGPIQDRLLEFFASNIQSFTFGAIKKEDAMQGIESISTILQKVGSSILSGVKHLFMNNPLSAPFVGISDAMSADGDVVDKILAGMGRSVQAFTFGAVKKEDAMQGIQKMPELLQSAGSALLSGVKHLFMNNPMSAPFVAISDIISTDGDIVDKVLSGMGRSVQAFTFGAVKKEDAMQGIQKISSVISSAASTIIKGVSDFMINNPFAALPRAIYGYTQSQGSFMDKMIGSLGYGIQSLTFGVVKHEDVTDKLKSTDIKTRASEMLTKAKDFIMKTPISAPLAFGVAWKDNANQPVHKRLLYSIASSIESITFGLVKSSDITSFIDGISISSIGNSIWGGIKDIFGFGDNSTQTSGTGKESPKAKFGMGGGEESNIKHYSQKDSKWASVPYNSSYDTIKQTIGDSGCAPMSAAIVQSAYMPDAPIDPKNIANYAIKKGYKETDGGTKPAFFTDYLSSKGINVNQTNDKNEIITSLKNNKPVILMGKSNGGSTPFGSNPHYVVATGIDNDGNIIISDPDEKTGGQKFSITDTLNATTQSIKTSYKNKGITATDPHGMDVQDKPTVKGVYQAMQEVLKVSKMMINDIFGIPNEDSSDYGESYSTSLPTGANGLVDMSRVDKKEVINRINNFFSKYSKLKGSGKYYYDGYKKYGFDPFLAAAITMQETGGKSNLLVNYNNPGGLMDPNTNWSTAQKFKSLSAGIDAMIKNLGSYGKKYGAYTIEEIGAKYCPVGAKNDPKNLNQYWVANVTKFYGQLTQGLSVSGSTSATRSLTEYFAKSDMKVTSPYGYRKNPFDNSKSQFHNGIDFGHSLGHKLTSPISGKVVQNYNSSSFGNTVRIQDSNGAVHTFAHMQYKSPLSVGRMVNIGDEVGKMGSTGNSTGPHLHYQINQGTDFKTGVLDPNEYFAKMATSGLGKDGFTTGKSTTKYPNAKSISNYGQGGGNLGTSNVNNKTVQTTNISTDVAKIIVELLVKIVENTNNLSAVVTLLSNGLKVDIPEKLLKSLKNGSSKGGLTNIIQGAVGENGKTSNDALIRSMERLAAE